jgi:NitT/TauT family transport system permease protein
MFDILWRVRGPLAVAWTFASIPNAIAFVFNGTATTEIFTGSSGIGQLLIAGVDTSNATLTFAVVGELTIVGVLLVVISMTLRRRVLHWMPESSVG